MSNHFQTPTGMSENNQLHLHGQIQARTTRKTEWNTIYGVNMAMAENQQKQYAKRQEGWQSSYSRLLVMQSATVGTAEDQLKDFERMVKDSKFYRQEVKRAVRGINYEFLEQWSKDFLKREYKYNQHLVLDIMDRCVETLKPDATKLYWCIKQEMDNERVPDSAIKAKAYMCALLVGFGCICHDAHMAIGPFILAAEDAAEKERQMRQAITDLINGKTFEDVKTDNYDYIYATMMKGARPTLLKMQTATIKQGVCGTWTHNADGNVAKCITAICNKVTDYGWLDRMSLQGLIDNGEFSEEIELLNQFDIFASGEAELTIDLLEAVMWFRHGKTDEEIEDALFAAYDNKYIGEQRVSRVMHIIKLLRLCSQDENGVEYFNSLDRIWKEHGRDAALKFHQKSQKQIEKNKAKKAQGKKVEENEQTYTEQDIIAAALSSKFGKVSKFKEKKPVTKVASPKVASSTPKVATSEPKPLQLEVQPPTKKRTNNRWSEEEEKFLLKEIQDGIPYATVSKELHRTETACYQRYRKIIQMKVREAVMAMDCFSEEATRAFQDAIGKELLNIENNEDTKE